MLQNPRYVELERVILNFSGAHCSLAMTRNRALHNPVDKTMQTDSTEEGELDACRSCDGEFTQAWDTAGAGLEPTTERA